MKQLKNPIIQSLSVLVLIATVLTASTPAHASRYTPRSAELIADASTGRILHGKDIYSLRHPASLTKVMTLYLTFAAIENGRFNMNTYLPVSAHAASMPASKLGLDAGDKISVKDCVLGLITESANDAAIVLAESIGGSESHFAQVMTAEARALGMKRTVYRNANGLPNPDQVTTAFDQAILTRAMMVHFPQYYGLFSTEEFAYNGVNHHNHNHLMDNYEGMDGLKTGFINASGFNLIASAKRSGSRLIGIVFGGKTARGRDNRMAQLLDAGFERTYAEAKGRGAQYASAPTVQTTADAVDVTTDKDADKDAKDNYQLAQGVNASTAQGDSEDDDDTTTVAVPKKGWGVQIGSYNSRQKGMSAIKQARQKSSDLRKASVQMVQVKAGKSTMYRARLSGLTEEAARSACTSLGKNCMPLPPRG